RTFSQATLIKMASRYEAFTHVRAHNLPQFLDNPPSTRIQGTNPTTPVQDTDTVKPLDAKKRPAHMYCGAFRLLEFELPGHRHRNHSVGPHGFDPLVLIPVSWLA